MNPRESTLPDLVLTIAGSERLRALIKSREVLLLGVVGVLERDWESVREWGGGICGLIAEMGSGDEPGASAW